MFLSRRYIEIDELKKDRDFYRESSPYLDEKYYDSFSDHNYNEEMRKYGVPVTIEKKKTSDGIFIDLHIDINSDEAYRSVGGRVSGFKVGPYMVEDAAEIFKFDHIIESKLEEEARRRLDEHFLSGDPSLTTKISYYRESKAWKTFEQKHNLRVRWWLKRWFYESLTNKYNSNKYNSFCWVYSMDYIEPPHMLKLLEKSLKQLDHPCLDVPDEEKKQVIRDLIGLNELLSDEKPQPLFQIIEQGGFEDSRDFFNKFVYELLNSTDEFSIFDAIQDKYTIILIVENAKNKAIQEMIDFRFNQYKRKDTYALNQPKIEKINSIVKKIKEIFVL